MNTPTTFSDGHTFRAVKALLMILVVSALGMVPMTSMAQGSTQLFPPITGCVDIQQSGVGLFGDGMGSVVINPPPGNVIAAYIEWVGGEDQTPGGNTLDGTSDLTINGSNIPGILAEPLPGGFPGGSGNAGWDATRDWFSWNANIGPGGPHGLIPAVMGGPIVLNISDWDIASIPGSDGRINGASVTLVYDTGSCLIDNTITLLTGVDWYFSGTAGNMSTELLVYPVDEAPVDRIVTMYFNHAGSDGGQTSCRGGGIWMRAGGGSFDGVPQPGPTDFDLNDSGSPASGINGGVEIVNDAFSPNPPCTPVVNPPGGGAGGSPYRAIPGTLVPPTGGFIDAEWSIIAIDVLIPAGADWVAFQLESEKDQSGESGSWAGGGVFIQLPTASLGDFVWEDLNANGIQDPGEPGIPGVTVELLNNLGMVIDTDVTDLNGEYFFTDLDPGTYSVRFTTPGGFTPTLQNQGGDDAEDSDANPATGETQQVTLGVSEVNPTLDAGYYRPASLGNFVWQDNDGDGIQDPDEPGIQGVTVTLYHCSDKNTPVASQMTGPNGEYSFTGLVPGEYCIVVSNIPANHSFSPRDQGGDDALDSDVDPTTGESHCVELTSGENDDTVDAGLVPAPASLGDRVWQDDDLDGIQDPGEPGIPNVTVRLRDAMTDAILATTMTNAMGNYMFNNLPPGKYVVEFVLPGGAVFTLQNQGGNEAVDSDADPSTGRADMVMLMAGDNNPDVDAGIIFPNPDINIEKTVYMGHNGGATCPGSELVIGANGTTVTYCFEITNTGNTFLDDITLNDADLGITRADVTLISGSEPLAPGATISFYYESSITGDLVNTAETSGNPTYANGNDIPGLNDPDDSDTAEVDEVMAGINLEKTVYEGHNAGASCPGGELVSGVNGTNVTYCFEVTNTGSTHLDAITLVDADLGITRVDVTLLSGSEPLAPGASLVFYYDATISGDLVNTAMTSGNPTDAGGVDIPGLSDPVDDDTAEVEEVPPPQPGIEIQKTVYMSHNGGASCPGGELVVGANGANVTYCFTVTNTGNTHLDAIVINDADLGITRADLTQVSGSEPLAPGASLMFYYETSINGDLLNTASTSGNPTDELGNDLPGVNDPTDDDTAEVDEVAAGIQIEKTVYAGHDAGASCPGGELVTGANGTNVTYCFEVTNTGSTHLDDIEIDDPNLGINRTNMTLLSGSEPLAPGATMVFFYQSAINGDLMNTAMASGNPTDAGGNDIPGLNDPSDDDTAEVNEVEAGIQIQKTVYEGHSAGAGCPGGELVNGVNGTNVTYCFAIMNTGSTHLDDITLTDADLGITRADVTQLSGSEPLAPGATIVFFYETSISGDLVNTASTSGNPTDAGGNDIPGLNDPTDDDTAEVKQLPDPQPGIMIDKTVYEGHDAGASCPGGELVSGANGASVTYCFVIMNIGDTHLDDIVINDPDLGITRADMTLAMGSEPLAPGSSLTFYYEASINGDLVNTASTSGNPTDEFGNDIPGLNDPSDDDTAEVDEVMAAIEIQKSVYVGHDAGASCPGGELASGANGTAVTYCFEVVNTGMTHLDDIVINDADLGITRVDMTQLSGSEPLAPGASLVFYYESTIQGDLVNTADASGNPTDEFGNDIPGLNDPSDDDTAEVDEVDPGDEADLCVTKVVNDAMPMVGEQVTFTIFAINNGPNDASQVTVLDLLPNGLSYDSHAASKGSYDTNTGVWDIGTLANGESATLTITATVTESGSHQNCATIACPQDDPNPDNNHSCATVNTEGSSGGGGAGVESQASEEMAVLFARRLFSRTMAQDESIAKRDAIELPALEASTVNSHVDGAGHLASVISALVPEQLQAASATGLVSTPTDLLGYTNATAVFAADYVRSDSRRAAALFATSTPAGQLYDHAKVICDRFGGGIYDELSLVSVAGHPFILAKMIQPSGEVDYAIEFVAYQMGNQFEVEHRFSWGEYTPRGSGEVMNFQIWGAVPAYTIALAEEVLANLGQLGQVSYQAEAAELPSVFVRTARYNQGQLTLELANRAGVSQARISGSYTRIENGGAELPMDQTISLPAGQIAEVTLETGSIFSATLEVSTAQSDARDRLYQADGPWSYASDANSPISGFQVHPQSFVIEGDYVIERSARLAGRVAEGGWASLFRYLKPDQGAFDASAYRALVLEARGTGEVELVFGQKSLSEGQAYRTRVSLSGSYQEHVIDFSQLSRPSGVTGGFVGSDLELLAFYPVGTGVFDIEVRSLRLSYAVPVSVEDVELPRAIVLDQNYPNPFNPVTQIRFGLPESSQVKLTVYDVLGRAVRVLADGRLSAGYHVVEFGGLELASGTYIYRLETPTKTLTQKMTLLK